MSGTPRYLRNLARAGAALAIAATLVGCGSSGSKASEPTSSSSVPAGAALHGSGPGEPCKSAAAPSAAAAPTVEMPKVAPDKLVSTDLKKGDGAEAAVGDNITVQYVGIACSSGTQFDSSFDRGQPISFDLLKGGLIQGWVDGIPGMKIGGRRQLVIPPALAYGDNPPTNAIRPGETLVFVVDLVAVTPPAAPPAN